MMDWAGVMIGIAAVGLVAFVLALWFWCACRLSGRISRMEEQFESGRKGERENDG